MIQFHLETRGRSDAGTRCVERSGRGKFLLGLALVLSGCGPESESAPAPAPIAAKSERPAARVEAARDRGVSLESLGYVEFAMDSGAEEGDGVVLHLEGQAANGYTLVCAIPLAAALLIDVEGRELRRWSDPEAGAWVRARLLRNGDLAVVGRGTDEQGFVVQRRSWNDEVLWTTAMKAHHDVRERSDGHLLALTWAFNHLPKLRLSRQPEFDDRPRIRDDVLAELSPEGELLNERSLGRGLTRANREIGIRVPDEWDPEVEPQPDMFHCNSIFVMEDAELAERDPIYALGNVLVSSRYQNLLFIVSGETGDVLWHWRPPGVEWQHEASVLASGNILFFDNGRDARGYSRILELEPLSRQVVWEYRADPPEDFFSRARGTVAELDNGALLIGNSDRGEAFQVNREGELLWRYRVPLYNEQGERSVVRVQYYEREFIDALLE